MCNECTCENEVKCSIIGTASLGFCCPLCVHYEESHECLKQKVGINRAKPASVSEYKLLIH